MSVFQRSPNISSKDKFKQDFRVLRLTNYFLL